jgi:hypothetical protein
VTARHAATNRKGSLDETDALISFLRDQTICERNYRLRTTHLPSRWYCRVTLSAVGETTAS